MASNRTAVLDAFAEHRCSAILRTNDAEVVRPALAAAIEGGFAIVEVTLTTPGCIDHLRELAANPKLVVGAGTVLTVEDAKAAMAAGARFMVSPVIDPQVVSFCRQHDLVSLPGTYTPSEMMQAHKAGADLVKLFPGPANGPEYLRMIRGPLPFLRVYPTSGVTEENAEEWLAAGAFGLGFVGSLFDPEDLRAHAFDRIRERAARMVGVVRGYFAAGAETNVLKMKGKGSASTTATAST